MPTSVSRLTLVLSIAGAILVTSVVSTGTLHAGTAPTVLRISPESQIVATGSNVVMQIRVDNVVNLGAYEFVLEFNPDVLGLVSVQNVSVPDGGFLEMTGRPAVCLGPTQDVDGDTVIDPGLVRFGCVTLGELPAGPTGSGLLATVTFASSCGGGSEVGFDEEILDHFLVAADLDVTDIPATLQGGSAYLNGGQVCEGALGDVNCNRQINAIDAALVLQLDARLVSSLACEESGDVNLNGTINPIDSLLILQFNANLIQSLPP